MRRKFERARDIVAKMRAREPRAALERLIGMEEGVEGLEGGEPDRAVRAAARLAPSAERAVLWAGVAAANVKKDKKLAVDQALIALGDAEAVTDGRRPYIRLALAHVLAAVDMKLALEIFEQAVTGLNQEHSLPQEQKRSETCIEIRQPQGDPKGKFLTSVCSGLDVHVQGYGHLGSIGEAIAALAARQLEDTEAFALNLADPSQLAQAIPELAAEWLNKLEL